MTAPRDAIDADRPRSSGSTVEPAGRPPDPDDGAVATEVAPARTDHRSVDEIETDLRSRLLRPGPTDRLWGWIGPLVVAAIAAVLRLVNLNHPTRLIFDETYYVKQAYSLLSLGYEGEWEGEDVNDRFKEGDFSDLSSDADYVVHPQIGKWLIAIGLRLFGADNGAGWRFSAAIAGAVTVLILARIARRLTGSTLLGTAAGLLLAVDGLHFTGSRIGLLDVFLGLFVIAGLAAVLIDREQSRLRLARAAAVDLAARGDGKLSDPWGPKTGMRWWLVAAGVLLGLGGGVKWSAIYALAVMGILVVVWDICARRSIGARLWFGAGVFRGGVPAFFALVPVAAVTYVAGWFSWFASPGAYLRQWAADQWAEHGSVERGWLPHALNSLWEYHLRAWDFHNGLDSEHTYEAHPAGWILQLRPTSFYWQSPVEGDCGADRCIQAITSVGNPVVWWLGALALLAILWIAIARRDWRGWVVLAGYAATYLPWLAYTHRTIFTFYAIALAPYVALALVVAIAWVGGLLPPLHGPARRPAETAPGAGASDPDPDGDGDGAASPTASDTVMPAADRSPALVPAGAPAGEDGSRAVRLRDGRVVAPDGSLLPDDAAPEAEPPAPEPAPAVEPEDAAEAAQEAEVRTRRRNRLGQVLLGVVCAAAVAVFVYFWPVWTGQTISYEFWRSHMWLSSWI